MNREKIQEILKKVTYPGFKRDIVSFGMVKDILVQDKQIKIFLQINSDNEKILHHIQTDIHEKMNEYREMDIQIHIQKPKNQSVQSVDQNNSLNQQPIPGV